MQAHLRNPHTMAPDVASTIVNTTYVVFLGLMFRTVFIVDYSTRVQVTLVFNQNNLLIALCLLVYFLFNWLSWNSFFRFQADTTDYYVALCVLGVLCLGSSFMLSLGDDFLARRATFWVFLAYALITFTDDVLLLDKGIRAGERGDTSARAFIYVRVLSITLKLFCIAFLAWGFFLMLAGLPDWQRAYLEKMQYAIIGFAALKTGDYLLLTRWASGADIAAI